jgi:hypothetical protein
MAASTLKYILLLFLLPCVILKSPAQDTMHKGVVLHADPRIGSLIKKHRASQQTTGSAGSGSGSIYYRHGFRVQIYNGPDRNKANTIKLDFMRRFPSTRAYLTYVSPDFRIKVGDFKSRTEAHEIYSEAKDLYGNACMIVPDIVIINTFKDD